MARQQRHARHAGAGHAALRTERHARAAAHGHHHHGHHTNTMTAITPSTAATPTTATITHKSPSAPAGDPAYIGPGGTATAPTTGTWNTAANWSPSGVPVDGTALSFGGSGATAYTSTNDIGTFVLGTVSLTSTASVTEIITGGHFNFGSTSSISQDNTGAFNIQTAMGGQNTAQTLMLTGNNTGLVTLSGVISEQNATHFVAITKTGTSTFILSGANTYTGGTNVNGGTLQVAATETAGTSGPLGKSGTISFGGGTLQYSSANTFDYSSRFSNAANQQYSIDTNSQTVTLGSALTSSGGTFTKLGAGTLTLSGANTYTGATTISAGTLSANKIVVSGGNSSLGNAMSAVILGDATNQGTLSYTGGSGTYTRGFTINAGGGQLINAGGSTLTVSTGGISAGGLFTVGGASSNNITISSVISGAGGLTKTGADTVTLSGPNTYTGTTTVTAGSLRITNATGLGTGGLTMNGGTLSLGVDATTYSVANLSGVSGATVEARDIGGSGHVNATLSVGSDGTSTTYSGVLQDNGNNNGGTLFLTKVGAGTLTLNGANTYTGATTVNAGTLKSAVANALGGTSGITVNNSGTLLLSASNTINDAATMTLNGNVTTNNPATKNLVLSGASEGSSTTSSATAGLGALTLLSRSTLDFLQSTSTIVFGQTAGSAFTDSGAFKLDIYNYVGDSTPAGNLDHLVFQQNMSGLTGDFEFWNGSSFVAATATQLGSSGFWEITPISSVPEPSTWVAGALALTSLVACRAGVIRRRVGQRRRISRLVRRS